MSLSHSLTYLAQWNNLVDTGAHFFLTLLKVICEPGNVNHWRSGWTLSWITSWHLPPAPSNALAARSAECRLNSCLNVPPACRSRTTSAERAFVRSLAIFWEIIHPVSSFLQGIWIITGVSEMRYYGLLWLGKRTRLKTQILRSGWPSIYLFALLFIALTRLPRDRSEATLRPHYSQERPIIFMISPIQILSLKCFLNERINYFYYFCGFNCFSTGTIVWFGLVWMVLGSIYI